MPHVTTDHYEVTSYSGAAGTSVAINDISASADAFFVVNISNRGGLNSTGSNVRAHYNDFSLSDLSTVAITADITSFPKTFGFSAVKYGGAASGKNEFIVRGHLNLDATAVSLTLLSSTISGADINKCVPFVMGQQVGACENWGTFTPKIDLLSIGANHLQVRAIRTAASASYRCRIALVEFTGSNWDVISGSKSASVQGSNDVVSISDVGSWSTAFVASSMRVPASEFWIVESPAGQHLIGPGATTTSLRWFLPSEIVSASLNDFVMQYYVVKNAEMDVRHRGVITGDATLAATLTASVSITAVASLSAALVVGYAAHAGTTSSGIAVVAGFFPRATNSIAVVKNNTSNSTAWQLAFIDFQGLTDTAAAVSSDLAGLTYSMSDDLTKPLDDSLDGWEDEWRGS